MFKELKKLQFCILLLSMGFSANLIGAEQEHVEISNPDAGHVVREHDPYGFGNVHEREMTMLNAVIENFEQELQSNTGANRHNLQRSLDRLKAQREEYRKKYSR